MPRSSKEKSSSSAPGYQWRSVLPDTFNVDRLAQKKGPLLRAKLSALVCLVTGFTYFWYRIKLTRTTFAWSDIVCFIALVAEIATASQYTNAPV